MPSRRHRSNLPTLKREDHVLNGTRLTKIGLSQPLVLKLKFLGEDAPWKRCMNSFRRMQCKAGIPPKVCTIDDLFFSITAYCISFDTNQNLLIHRIVQYNGFNALIVRRKPCKRVKIGASRPRHCTVTELTYLPLHLIQVRPSCRSQVS